MTKDSRLIEAVLRQDLYCFIQAAFPIVSPGVPFARNWHLEAIAYYLTRVLEGEIKRLIITIPPQPEVDLRLGLFSCFRPRP
jgi:hypothetical protein